MSGGVRSGTCPFCPHERHDSTDCYGRAVGGKACECCGPTDAEQAALDAPSEILSWLREVIEAETYGGSARAPVDVTDVVQHVNPDFLRIDTRHGRFRIKIEKEPE